MTENFTTKDLRKLVMETVDSVYDNKILTENPEELLKGAIAKYSAQVDESEIRKLFGADKTSGKNHFSWLLKNYIEEKNVLKPDGEMTLAEYMAEKYQLLMRLQHVNGMPKNFKAMKFSAVLSAMSDVFRKKSEDSDKETATADKSLVKAYEDDEFVLYEVLSKEASCHFGDGTSWCISKREEQNYEQYESSGCKFFALLFKTKTYNATLKSGQKKNQNYRHMIVVSEEGQPPEVLAGGILEWRNPNQTSQFAMNEVPAKSFNGIIQFLSKKFPDFPIGEKTVKGLSYRNGLLNGEITSPGRKEVYENGQLSNKNGPAYISYSSNGEVSAVRYYVDGKLHRTDGPADVDYMSNGKINRMNYYVNGVLHRTDGPAKFGQREKGGTIEQYFVNGKLHRADGPNVVYRNENGKVIQEEFRVEGGDELATPKYHRDDGPAIISHYNNGKVKEERYFVNGKQHRSDGPADVLYDEDGKVSRAFYFIDYRLVTREKHEEWRRSQGLMENKITIPTDRTLLTESFLTMWGHSIRKALEKMFDIPVYENVTFRGRRTDVEALYRTLAAEKRYIDSFISHGLSNPAVTNSKYDLERAIYGFESQTGIKWPII
jgi:antitoxin component YwqK of YwqJK toxin-antitoxin module